MNPEEQVRAALRALAEHDRSRESSLPAPRLPGFTVARPVARPSARRWLVAGPALAAAAGWLMVVRPWEIQAPQEPPAPRPAVVEMAVEGLVEDVPPAVPVAAPVEQPPREVVTDFFPLSDTQLPFERGQLLRVMVPAVTMQRVGLPVRPERWADEITADVLVGEEGLPRAIRFVSYQQ